MKIILLALTLSIALLGCVQQDIEGNCILMQDPDTGQRGCYGCSGGICIDPPMGLEPLEDSGAQCAATEDGCKLLDE